MLNLNLVLYYEDLTNPKNDIAGRILAKAIPANESWFGYVYITDADTKNMDSYVAKRQRQMAEQRKLKGFN